MIMSRSVGVEEADEEEEKGGKKKEKMKIVNVKLLLVDKYYLKTHTGHFKIQVTYN